MSDVGRELFHTLVLPRPSPECVRWPICTREMERGSGRSPFRLNARNYSRQTTSASTAYSLQSRLEFLKQNSNALSEAPSPFAQP